ncbi:MAG: hypothetical protein HY985_06010 [Magnetospirillum sp.]|nr:hypothetical protein [Magnetospirillum sp.]
MSRIEIEGRTIFTAILRDITPQREAEASIQRLNGDLLHRAAQLEVANRELEAFSYSVSHDLRQPLRSIDGFSQVLLEDYGDRLDGEAKDSLNRIRAASQRMAQLIDDILNLSRLTRGEMHRDRVDLSALARQVADEFSRSAPERDVAFHIAPDLIDEGDPHLVRSVLANLLGNAWKYTSKRPSANIVFGARSQADGPRIYFVQDDGVGFDMTYADKLFGAFQRLHGADEYPGTGVGLATVQRIVHKHGGEVWAEAAIDKGASFFFTLH